MSIEDHKDHNDQFIDLKDHEISKVTFGALSDLWAQTPFLILQPAAFQHTWEIAETANFLTNFANITI